MVQAGVVLSVRRAGVDDLGAIEGLARVRRESLAVWSPTWWRPASSANEAHRQWLSFLVTSGHADCRVVLDGGAIVGCAVVVGQPSHAFIDDLAVDNPDRWPSVLVALADAVRARPALSCVPSNDTRATAAMRAAGINRIASYWLLAPEPNPSPGMFEPCVSEAPAGPPHTFEPIFGAGRSMCLHVDGGVVVASPSISAPPIYDPGGPVRIIDRVVGAHPDILLRAGRGAAYDAGDAMVCVVAGADDTTLNHALTSAGAVRTVDVVEWPQPPA